MNYGICTVSVAPLRAEPDDRTEMVSQLLFGERVIVIERSAKWCRVKAEFDNYVGWCDPKMITEIAENSYHKPHKKLYASDLFNLIVESEFPMTVTFGAHLGEIHDNLIKTGNRTFEYNGEIIQAESNELSIPEIAEMYINTPYLWGGKSPYGIDCSGLVQQVFKMKNIRLPRDAWQQAETGEVLSFVEEAQPGDLAFFDNEEGNIIHVGIMLEDRKIIHAHGRVRIDPVDSTGIFNTDSQAYSHKLRFIRRIF